MISDEHYYGREQSQTKHRVLERYLQAFAPIIGSAYDEIVYVDCLAGPWEAKDESLSDTSFSRALSVFRECKKQGRCRNVRALLIESDSSRYAQLEAYGKQFRDIEVVTQQWDFTEHVQDVVDFATRSRNSFPFFFIDPTGWREIRIDLIRPILRTDPGEVLINFMSSWVSRFLDDPSKCFEELLGQDTGRLRGLRDEELEDELIDTYADRVRKAGNYAYTCAIPILMPDRDFIHYHLVYGTRNFKGLVEFKKAEEDAIPYMHEHRAAAQRRREEEKNGQGFLLEPSATYCERRFSNFNQRRLSNARGAVIKILSCTPSVAYQTLFQESMQYSTVLQEDLREWLRDWEKNGIIAYKNWQKKQRVPHPDTIISVLNPALLI
jgi:three-Cys-motif partner protein